MKNRCKGHRIGFSPAHCITTSNRVTREIKRRIIDRVIPFSVTRILHYFPFLSTVGWNYSYY